MISKHNKMLRQNPGDGAGVCTIHLLQRVCRFTILHNKMKNFLIKKVKTHSMGDHCTLTPVPKVNKTTMADSDKNAELPELRLAGGNGSIHQS